MIVHMCFASRLTRARGSEFRNSRFIFHSCGSDDELLQWIKGSFSFLELLEDSWTCQEVHCTSLPSIMVISRW